MPTVAIIGSFRQHLKAVSTARQIFVDAGWDVVTPVSGVVDDSAALFVRFDTDDAKHDDATVQVIALHRILSADMVYVCAPGGYVGRTTCFEIGWIVSRNRPLYFSETPHDLPLHVPTSAVLPLSDLRNLSDMVPQPFCQEQPGLLHELQYDLIEGRVRDV